MELRFQFWTSRGFALLDVNYRGSTGYGRPYRDALRDTWGIYDVDDCVFGAQYLVDQGIVDEERLAVRGGSASGMVVRNNLFVPLIVSSKVEINAFISILGIIIGGAIGGISGMFLAIPLIAILKVVFDRIKPLEPWGYLFGDDLPKTYSWHRLRLPRYDHENMETTLEIGNDATKPKPLFTETTSQP